MRCGARTRTETSCHRIGIADRRIADATQTYAFETFVLMHHRISLYFNGQWVDTCFPKVSN